jgi:arylsulfatase A
LKRLEIFRRMSNLCSMRIVLTIVLFSLAALRAAGGSPVRPPNILFILTDDQGWATLGCYGNQLVPTPHLDGLARDGVRFTDAYVMPQCTPTRAALLTGQHTARNGMWHVLPWYGSPWARVSEPMFREQFPRDGFNLPKGLRAAGYTTGMAGKWHLNNNTDGEYTALNAAAADAYGFDFVAPRGVGGVGEGDKWVDHLTDAAIGFIQRQPQNRPWFFYLAHHTIHGKVSAPPALVEKYLARGAPRVGLHNATYLAAIEHLDNSVGRLLAALDARGQRDRTLVVFLSDNGGVFEAYDKKAIAESNTPGERLVVDTREFSNAPLRAGKGSPYEGGIRVPCLVRWPGVVAAGTTSGTPIHVVDWLPTLLAAAGEKAPATYTVDGTNLVPLLRGETVSPRSLYWYLPLYDLRWGATPAAVIREGDWKLIEWFGDWFDAEGKYHTGRHLELFNLRNDVGETRNLGTTEAKRAQKMSDQLRSWMESIPVPIPTTNPHFDRSRAFVETKEKQMWNR